MCECYQIGGRFIAEDPDCPVHGWQANERREENRNILSQLRQAVNSQDTEILRAALIDAISHIESLE